MKYLENHVAGARVTQAGSRSSTAWRFLPALQRFEESYIPEPNSGCWLWTARVSRPYERPMLTVKSRETFASRFAYSEFVRPIPPGLLICHRCNNQYCVNPDHLYAGTHKQNSADMVRARRHYAHSGEAARAELASRALAMVAKRQAQTNCKRGHVLSGDNLIIDKRGYRGCHTCMRMHQRIHARLKRARLKGFSQ